LARYTHINLSIPYSGVEYSTPTFALMPKSFLTAEWKYLLMANYAISPSILQPYLPFKTELDPFNEVHYISLVGFLFDNVKVKGLSFPFHRRFEEVNLRFYVRYKEAGAWKRGVVFLKEIVPRQMISLIANTLYGEAYCTHAMNHSIEKNNDELHVCYQWKVDSEWNFLKASADSAAKPILQGSEEEFIAEHYWGYTFINEKCSGTYQVAHPRWNIHKVNSYEINCSAEKLYGPAFSEALQHQPRSVFLAEGSAISVMKGSKIFATA
jgi:uncharacterized protein YqjF (DUF2071 family)